VFASSVAPEVGVSSNGTPLENARVLQASGLVSVQAACTVDEAVVLMQARAEQTNCTLGEIAAGVINHSIRFD